MTNQEILFTPAALLDFLLQIDEFDNKEIGVNTTLDGNVEVVIDDSSYIIDCSNAVEIDVDPEVVDTISDVNESTYEDLIESEEFSIEPIEGGVIKELATTLLVGGAVRMGAAALKNFMK